MIDDQNRVRVGQVLHSGGTTNVCLAVEGFGLQYGGGVTRFARYLAGLRERGIRVHVFTGTPTPAKAAVMGIPRTWDDTPVGTWLPPERMAGVMVQRVRLPDRGSLLRRNTFYRLLLQHCRGPQAPAVVQILALRSVTFPWIWRIRREGIGVVMTATIIPPRRRPGLRGRIHSAVRRRGYSIVDRVIVGSEAMREGLVHHVPGPRLSVIGHGVNLARFQAEGHGNLRTQVRRELGIPEDAPMLLYMGGLSPRKGIDLLLESWRQIAAGAPSAHLVLVGPATTSGNGPDDFSARMGKLLLRSGAEERVHFVGVTDEPERYLCAADAFLFGSHREGFPNVLLEAMATGLPLVTTAFIGLTDELGRAGVEFLLSDRDPSVFAATVLRILNEPALAASLGRAARLWVETHHDVASTLDAYARIYTELAASRSRT